MYVFCGECAHFDVFMDLSVNAGYFGKCEFLNLNMNILHTCLYHVDVDVHVMAL
jgi:hypothetical protein